MKLRSPALLVAGAIAIVWPISSPAGEGRPGGHVLSPWIVRPDGSGRRPLGIAGSPADWSPR